MMVIVSDVAGVLDRVGQLLDSVESAGTPGWVVQLELISLSEVAAERMEVDVVPSGQHAAIVDRSAGSWANGAVSVLVEDAELIYLRSGRRDLIGEGVLTAFTFGSLGDRPGRRTCSH